MASAWKATFQYSNSSEIKVLPGFWKFFFENVTDLSSTS